MKYGFFYLKKVSLEETKLIAIKEKSAISLNTTVISIVLILLKTGMLFTLNTQKYLHPLHEVSLFPVNVWLPISIL